MKILLIHQYYKTPEEGGAIRSYYLARHLASLGHEVHVITAYNEPHYLLKETDNITIHYLPVYYTNHLSFWSRIHAFYRFVRKAIYTIKKLQPVDLNYVITTPLSTGIIALYARRKFKIPYIFEVGDLWPEAPVQLKVLNNFFLKKMAYKLEAISYQNADVLIALSDDIKKAIKMKVPKKTVAVITNMADTAFFDHNARQDSLLEQYGVKDKFVIAYTGTVGVANELEYLLDVADFVQHNQRLHFIVAGSGARWEAIRTKARERSLTNITFTGAVNKTGIREIMNVADAVFVSFKNVPVLATGSPNKFFDGLAAGKLIIINFEGWIKTLIDQNACGFSYPPEQPEVFAAQLKPYVEDQNRLKTAQNNARTLANQFTPEVQLEKLNRLITYF